MFLLRKNYSVVIPFPVRTSPSTALPGVPQRRSLFSPYGHHGPELAPAPGDSANVSDVHGVLAPAALPSSWELRPRLLSWSRSTPGLMAVFPCCLRLSPEVLSFPKNAAFSGCDQSRKASVLPFFASRNVSGLTCARSRLFVSPAAQGICRAFLQTHISEESICFNLTGLILPRLPPSLGLLVISWLQFSLRVDD